MMFWKVFAALCLVTAIVAGLVVYRAATQGDSPRPVASCGGLYGPKC